jgi:hypothetical protein
MADRSADVRRLAGGERTGACLDAQRLALLGVAIRSAVCAGIAVASLLALGEQGGDAISSACRDCCCWRAVMPSATFTPAFTSACTGQAAREFQIGFRQWTTLTLSLESNSISAGSNCVMCCDQPTEN